MSWKTWYSYACLACGALASTAFAQSPATGESAPLQVPALSLDPFAAGSPKSAFPSATTLAVSQFQASTLTLDAQAPESPELELFKDMPIVVAAGKREQTLRQVPASVSIVTADDIDLFGYRNLADVLRNQRSFYLHTDGLNWFAGTRGFLRPGEWNARMLVLVDGRPTRDVIYGQTNLDQDFVVPMEAVKRVEIIRGPGSALYGGNAVFSTVDVITKTGAEVNGAQIKLQGGTQDTGRASVLLGTVLPGGWDVIGNFTGYTSQGDNHIHYPGVTDAAHNFGNIDNSDYEGVESGWVKARNGDWTIELDTASRYKDNRAATYLTSFVDPGSMHEERGNASVRYDHEVAENQSVHAMAYYGHYRYLQSYRFDDDGNGNPYWYTTQGQSDWLGQEFHYDWQATESLHLLAGADATQALDAQQRDHDTISGSLLDVESSYNAWGLFAEAEYKATSWLTFTGGVRLDDVQRIGLSVSPRFALILTPTVQDTVKLLYGSAFRAPNLYEMYYAAPGTNTPNPSLRPEGCDTYEVVWERQWGDGWSTSVDPYIWTMSHTLGDATLPDNSIQIQNVGASRAYGIEGEIQKKWDNGARLRAYGSLGLADHEGETLTHSPAWIIGAAWSIPVINARTFLSVDPQIVGPMKSDLDQYTNPSFITNVVLTSKDVVKGVDLQLGVYNLFSEFARLPRNDESDHYQPTLDYPHTQFLFSVTLRF